MNIPVFDLQLLLIGKIFLYIHFDGNRAVIASKYVGMDGCIQKFITEPFGYYKIIYTPTGIVCTCIESVCPPRIGYGFWI